MTARFRAPWPAAATLALLSMASPAAMGATAQRNFAPHPHEPGGHPMQVRVEASGEPAGDRSYAMSTTAPQREGARTTRTFAERMDSPRVRSSDLLFDALFALAVDDARSGSVSRIHDGAYDDGKPIPCQCFETGEKWTWVWTRDTSFSGYLGLAWLDPARTANSLLFKVSGPRAGLVWPEGVPADSWQVLQDTGSGGSWPVSTDRVAWALGAEAVLDQLSGTERASFAERAWHALHGTLEADRIASFDASDGLYTGEQSFLDWREQTYAPYVVDDLTQLAQSRALSTNVLHYDALRFAQRLARQRHDAAAAARYGGWADALRKTINARFWVPEEQLYASLLTPDDRPAAIGRYDLLGEALAVITGVADPERARAVLAHYPHAPFGAPVYWPQQPAVPVYHNRSIWPFVTAFALEAAAKAGNEAVADNAVDSLMRAAALHLTNTENLEWLTGHSRFDEGPVINSPRQIWSVAGYVGMVTRTLFGLHAGAAGLSVTPFLTAHLRGLFQGDNATLERIAWQGRRIDVRLHLPPPAESGVYPVRIVRLNGQTVHAPISVTQLAAHNFIDVEFAPAVAADRRIRLVPDVAPPARTDPAVTAPPVPAVQAHMAGGVPRLDISIRLGEARKLRYQVWRDGVLMARGVRSQEPALQWSDTPLADAHVRHCYRVVAVDAAHGLASHPSLPACIDEGATLELDWRAAQTLPGTPAGGDNYELAGVRIAESGRYAFTLRYDNHRFAINTGITNAVKRLELRNAAGALVAAGVVQMPHIAPLGAEHPLRDSTELRLTLPAGIYTLRVTDFFNMSYLQSNALYGGPGGRDGPENRADIHALRITRLPDPAAQLGDIARTGWKSQVPARKSRIPAENLLHEVP